MSQSNSNSQGEPIEITSDEDSSNQERNSSFEEDSDEYPRSPSFRFTPDIFGALGRMMFAGNDSSDESENDHEDEYSSSPLYGNYQSRGEQLNQRPVSRDIPLKDLANPITNASFEKLIRLYCLPETFDNSHLYIPKCRDVVLDKNHMKGKCAESSVNIYFDDSNSKITNCDCSSCKEPILWCQHVVALLLLFSRFPNCINNVDKSRDRIASTSSDILALSIIRLAKKNPDFLSFVNLELEKLKKNSESENAKLLKGLVEEVEIVSPFDLPIVSTKKSENYFDTGVFATKLEEELRRWRRLMVLSQDYNVCRCGGWPEYRCNACETSHQMKNVQTLFRKYIAIAKNMIDAENFYSGIEILLEMMRVVILNMKEINSYTHKDFVEIFNKIIENFQEVFINFEPSSDFLVDFQHEIQSNIEDVRNETFTALMKPLETFLAGNWNSPDLVAIMSGKSVSNFAEPKSVVQARVKYMERKGMKQECLLYTLAVKEWSVYYRLMVELGHYKQALQSARSTTLDIEIVIQLINSVFNLKNMPNNYHLMLIFEFGLDMLKIFSHLINVNQDVNLSIIWTLLDIGIEVSRLKETEKMILDYGTINLENYIEFLMAKNHLDICKRIYTHLFEHVQLGNCSITQLCAHIRLFWACCKTEAEQAEFGKLIEKEPLGLTVLEQLYRTIPILQGMYFVQYVGNTIQFQDFTLAHFAPKICLDVKMQGIAKLITLTNIPTFGPRYFVRNLELLFDHFAPCGKDAQQGLFAIADMYFKLLPSFGFNNVEYTCSCSLCAPIQEFLRDPTKMNFELTQQWDQYGHSRYLDQLVSNVNIDGRKEPVMMQIAGSRKRRHGFKVTLSKKTNIYDYELFNKYKSKCVQMVKCLLDIGHVDFSGSTNPFVGLAYLQEMLDRKSTSFTNDSIKIQANKNILVAPLNNPLIKAFFEREYIEVGNKISQFALIASQNGKMTETQKNDLKKQIMSGEITNFDIILVMAREHEDLKETLFSVQLKTIETVSMIPKYLNLTNNFQLYSWMICQLKPTRFTQKFVENVEMLIHLWKEQWSKMDSALFHLVQLLEFCVLGKSIVSSDVLVDSAKFLIKSFPNKYFSNTFPFQVLTGDYPYYNMLKVDYLISKENPEAIGLYSTIVDVNPKLLLLVFKDQSDKIVNLIQAKWNCKHLVSFLKTIGHDVKTILYWPVDNDVVHMDQFSLLLETTKSEILDSSFEWKPKQHLLDQMYQILSTWKFASNGVYHNKLYVNILYFFQRFATCQGDTVLMILKKLFEEMTLRLPYCQDLHRQGIEVVLDTKLDEKSVFLDCNKYTMELGNMITTMVSFGASLEDFLVFENPFVIFEVTRLAVERVSQDLIKLCMQAMWKCLPGWNLPKMNVWKNFQDLIKNEYESLVYIIAVGIFDKQFAEFKQVGTFTSFSELKKTFLLFDVWNKSWKHEIINWLFAIYRKADHISAELAKRNYDMKLRFDHVSILLAEHTEQTPIGTIAFSIVCAFPKDIELLIRFLKLVEFSKLNLSQVGMNLRNSSQFFVNIDDLDVLKQVLMLLDDCDSTLMMEMFKFRMEIIKISLINKTNVLSMDWIWSFIKFGFEKYPHTMVKSVWKKYFTKVVRELTRGGVYLEPRFTFDSFYK